MGKIAFVYPGQGAQYVGMGQDVFNNVPDAQDIFAEADKRLGYSLSNLCFNGPEEKLRLTLHTQPALLTTSMACYQLIKKEGIKPDFLAGHSLGEYSALVAGGALDFSDAVWLVEQRGKFMQEAVPPGEGTMAAILGLGIEQVEKLCRVCSSYGVIEPANYNCPGQIVLAGTTPAVEKAVAIAKDYGAKRAVPLPVSGPFHSSLLKPASEKLAEALKQVEIKDLQIPVMANVSADIVSSAEQVYQGLVEQVSSPVKWSQSIRRMIELGTTIFVEIGAGKVLSGLIKKIDKDVTILNVEDMESWENTVAKLKEGV